MAIKKPDNWRSGQTTAGMGPKGNPQMSSGTEGGKRKSAKNDADPESVEFTPAQDANGNPAGYVGKTRYKYDPSSGSSTEPTTTIHATEEDAGDHLANTFGQIDTDETLDPAEKRRKKMKASLSVGRPE